MQIGRVYTDGLGNELMYKGIIGGQLAFSAVTENERYIVSDDGLIYFTIESEEYFKIK